jgi:pimeloyl-ACP methyl ester carboxylesterase
MSTHPASTDTTVFRPRPLVLVRGFGGLGVDDEQQNAYQGFNNGTVYPGRRGANYIYEGFVLRALKSPSYAYTDATNVVGYYATPQSVDPDFYRGRFDQEDVSDDKVVVDAAMADVVLAHGVDGTMWIYRYYDVEPRQLKVYGQGLARLLRLIEKARSLYGEGEPRGVDVIAHSMGGLVVREALRVLHEAEPDQARTLVHKVVTLGTPHRGIAFQDLPRWLTSALPGVRNAADELAAFDPHSTEFLKTGEYFDLDRVLTVVGTNYRAYGNWAASAANRLSSLLDEGSLAGNRSDGLVKQSSAQLPGAPRTFVDKCHGGIDSLVTSREAYEIAMRFFHGTHHVRLWLDAAAISRGRDLFGRSEYYVGVSIKARGSDFELFHQDKDAENCYGPFHKRDLSDGPPRLEDELRKPLSDPGDRTTGWAGDDRLVWEGWIDEKLVPDPAHPQMVFRLDVYVGERDKYGVGFSDDKIFSKQYYVQVFEDPTEIFVHTSADLLSPRDPHPREEVEEAATSPGDAGGGDPGGPNPPSPAVQRAQQTPEGWTFGVSGTGFSGTFRVGIERVTR